jgi:predicted dehydrogenase
VSLAAMVFGAPARVASLAELGATGVDEQAAIILGYDGGQLAVLTAAIRTPGPHEAIILGTEGSIRLHEPWWRPTPMTLARDGRPDELIDEPAVGNGYNYEAAEVMRCLREGRTESDVIALDESLSIMRTLDAIRAQWGLRYPGE